VKLPHFIVKLTAFPERVGAQSAHGNSSRFSGEAHIVLLRLSENSIIGQITSIYGVRKEQYTIYVVYYEVEKHFSGILIMRSTTRTLIFMV
jgi:hypothetical protein